MICKDDVILIVQYAEVIIQRMKVVPGGCLYYSSILAAMIKDNTAMQSVLSVGTLQISDRIIFGHSPIKPLLNSGKNVITQWDGHAWVTIDDWICDLSLFQTVFSEKTPHEIKKIVGHMFQDSPAYLIAQKSRLKDNAVIYSEKEVLDDKHMNMLITNSSRLGLFEG